MNMVWRCARPLAVLGTGSALPGDPLDTEALLARLKALGVDPGHRRAHAVARRLGVRTRHAARTFAGLREGTRPGAGNAELAAAALGRALDAAGLRATELGYLIGHTATPAEALPSNISRVAALSGYGGPVAEFRQACTGFVNALALAGGLLADPAAAPVAIVGSETGSVFFDPRRSLEESDQLVNLLQMGDGAGAVVLGPARPGETRARLLACAHGRLADRTAPGIWLAAGGSRTPQAATGWPEFGQDFTAIRAHGADLLAAARAALAAEAGPESWYLPHQANGRMDEVLRPFLPPGSRVVVHGDRVGNTGSASIWLAFDHARGTLLAPGEHLFALGAEASNHSYGGFHYIHA